MGRKRVLDTLLVLMERLAKQDPAAFREYLAKVDQELRGVGKFPTK